MTQTAKMRDKKSKRRKKKTLCCTAGQCRAALEGPHEAHVHPRLGVVVCERCLTVSLAPDGWMGQDGSEDFCTWCGEGHESLFLCDKCPRVFCADCVRFNLGEDALKAIEESDGELLACVTVLVVWQFANVW